MVAVLDVYKRQLHQNIFVHRTVKLPDGTEVSGFTETKVGLLIFNENIPQDLGFIDRSKAENALKFEVEFHAVSYTHLDVYKRQD